MRKETELLLQQRKARLTRDIEQDPEKLLHELIVHQIELELQNEELKKAHEEITASRDAYFHLFHKAPVGYAVLDRAGKILRVNATLAQWLDTAPEVMEYRGFPYWVADDDRPLLLARFPAFFNQPEHKQVEVRLMRSGGERMWARLTASRMQAALPLFHPVPNADCLLVNITDITKQKESEAQREQLIRDKDVLLKEMHHRVKNNFTIVSSLLHIQSFDVKDPKTLHILEACRNRIRTMALIHEDLCQSDSLGEIQLCDYLRRLMRHLADSFQDKGRVRLHENCSGIAVEFSRAIPCGLIVNELVSNAFKYAFAPDTAPEDRQVRVSAARDKDRIRLAVEDNGTGLPEDFDPESAGSLGLRLVTLLAREQLQGTLACERDKGTRWQILFPEKADRPAQEKQTDE